jgi:hypothetical protein
MHEHYRMQEGQEHEFYQWSLYTAHHNTDLVFGDLSEAEVLFEIKTIRRSGKAAKNRLIKNREWGGQLLFTHWLNYGLICVIEISSSNLLVHRHGGEFSPFVGARIVVGIMRFITNSMMIRPNAPGSIIGGGCVVAQNEVFCVKLPAAVQKMRSVLEFWMSFGNGMSLPHSLYFSYLQCAWDAANLTLQDLMSPALDCAVDPNNRNCPICLEPILLRKFGIPPLKMPKHIYYQLII